MRTATQNKMSEMKTFPPVSNLPEFKCSPLSQAGVAYAPESSFFGSNPVSQIADRRFDSDHQLFSFRASVHSDKERAEAFLFSNGVHEVSEKKPLDGASEPLVGLIALSDPDLRCQPEETDPTKAKEGDPQWESIPESTSSRTNSSIFKYPQQTRSRSSSDSKTTVRGFFWKRPSVSFANARLTTIFKGLFVMMLFLSIFTSEVFGQIENNASSFPSSSSGLASYYGVECCRYNKTDPQGCPTASGRSLRELVKRTPYCASWGYPFGTRLKVSANGKSTVVVVLDRGPAKRLHRLIDLNKKSFQKICNVKRGVCRVTVEVLK